MAAARAQDAASCAHRELVRIARLAPASCPVLYCPRRGACPNPDSRPFDATRPGGREATAELSRARVVSSRVTPIELCRRGHPITAHMRTPCLLKETAECEALVESDGVGPPRGVALERRALTQIRATRLSSSMADVILHHYAASPFAEKVRA